MRFLCLHGAGTNSKILEKQTAALLRELGPDHTFSFVEGAVESEISSELQALSAADDRCFVYYRPFDKVSFQKAISDLGCYIEDEGPFDGILAFSQGTSVASAYLIEQQQKFPDRRPPVSCAVFICGRNPYLDSGLQLYEEQDQTAGYAGSCSRDVGPRNPRPLPRCIATTHIWGANDQQEPGQGRLLHDFCSPGGRFSVEHNGGHEVPSSRMPDKLYEAARKIRLMVAYVEHK